MEDREKFVREEEGGYLLRGHRVQFKQEKKNLPIEFGAPEISHYFFVLRLRILRFRFHQLELNSESNTPKKGGDANLWIMQEKVKNKLQQICHRFSCHRCTNANRSQQQVQFRPKYVND